nr:hypothetical protein CFP56_13196 [Quercus suber]
MAATIDNPSPVTTESKSARKKKAKAETGPAATTNGSALAPAVPDTTKEDSSIGLTEDVSGEHPHIKELQKQIRSVNKKLGGMVKTDAVVAENPGISLDDLVAQRKINADQRASALKKPGLVAHLVQLEAQITQFREFESDFKQQLHRQKEQLIAQHENELEKVKESLTHDVSTTDDTELRQKLLMFSQFLRAAAAKRGIEDEITTDENQAFEGALLLVYGGDARAVDTAINIIEGSDEQVPNIEGLPLSIKYSQIKKASIDHAPYQTEEDWIDQVAEAGIAEGAINGEPISSSGPTSDPTIVHAGLTELESRSNGVDAVAAEPSAAPANSAGDEGGNLAGDNWDTGAGGAENNGLDGSYEVIPRDAAEVDVTASAATATQDKIESWADDAAQEAAVSSSNKAGEKWDVQAPGEAAQDTVSSGAPSTNLVVPVASLSDHPPGGLTPHLWSKIGCPSRAVTGP